MTKEEIEQMPRYHCHKVVRATKIKRVTYGEPYPAGTMELVIELGGTEASVPIEEGWVAQHKPQAGGYLVAYEDGYLSFSPPVAFESGYDLMQEPASRRPQAPEPEPEEATKPGKRLHRHA